jgi:hypothetical protein
LSALFAVISGQIKLSGGRSEGKKKANFFGIKLCVRIYQIDQHKNNICLRIKAKSCKINIYAVIVAGKLQTAVVLNARKNGSQSTV